MTRVNKVKLFFAALLLSVLSVFGFAATASAFSESVHVSEPSEHVSAPSESEHVSTSEEESSTSRSSSVRSSSSSSTHVSTPHTQTYSGRTYNVNETHYYNSSGFWIWYWIFIANSNHNGGYYECFDQNHNRVGCDRNNNKTVQHNGVNYSVSNPYQDTDSKTVAFYLKLKDGSNKTYFECFDSSYNRISCDRK